MTLKISMRGRNDLSKCARLLGELSNLEVDVAAVQGTHFTCPEDCRVLKGDFVVSSAFGSRCSAGTSLLVGRGLNAIVNLVFEDDRGRLVVADVAVKSFEFWVVAAYAPNSVGERRSFFRHLGLFFDDSKRLILVGDWNASLITS